MPRTKLRHLDGKPDELGFAYPRPQLRREPWWSLNGPWDFAFDAEGQWTRPEQVNWQQRITVPFAPETKLSGLGETGFFHACWYRRKFEAPPLEADQRLILHFGAVDYHATVWVNGQLACQHEGGYTPFNADITPLLNPSGPQTVVVRAEDDPHDLAKPRGKQDWQLKPHSIWYPRTSGIWQTVWLERVGSSFIRDIVWVSSVDRWHIDFRAYIGGDQPPCMRLRVRLQVADRILADDDVMIIAGEAHRTIVLSDPGIDDYRNELLWWPSTPTLIGAELELRNQQGQILDQAFSYTALRSIAIHGDRIVLNGRPMYLRMALDQGYYPDSGITAPDDAAFEKDVRLAKQAGFNGVRRHQLISDPRYLYWADRLGLMVWEEMPSPYRYTRESVQRLSTQWAEAIRRDVSHPSIITWVPFNESWGVPDLPDSSAQRHWVQAMYHLTRTLDPTRPVVGNDGWESVATDIIGIHDYDSNPERITARYGGHDANAHLFRHERPGGRMLLLDHETHSGQPIMLTEFGGIAVADNDATTWGYSEARDATTLNKQYTKLLEAVRSLPMLSGFCYTQFTDTYQEANGLLRMDRTPKFPLKQMALATAGDRVEREQRQEQTWREHLMLTQWRQYAVPENDYRMQEH